MTLAEIREQLRMKLSEDGEELEEETTLVQDLTEEATWDVKDAMDNDIELGPLDDLDWFDREFVDMIHTPPPFTFKTHRQVFADMYPDQGRCPTGLQERVRRDVCQGQYVVCKETRRILSERITWNRLLSSVFVRRWRMKKARMISTSSNG